MPNQHTPLTGYGYGACIFATQSFGQQSAYIINHDQQQKNAQAASTTT